MARRRPGGARWRALGSRHGQAPVAPPPRPRARRGGRPRRAPARPPGPRAARDLRHAPGVARRRGRRGRLTRDDAQAMANDLVARGRRQAEDFLADLDELLGRGRSVARSRAALEPRAAGGRAGSSFPIAGYEDLDAREADPPAGGPVGAELRRVRAFERRHRNRKTVPAGRRAAPGLTLPPGAVSTTGPPTTTRPQKGEELDLRVDASPSAARRRPPRRLRRLRPRTRCPATACARW